MRGERETDSIIRESWKGDHIRRYVIVYKKVQDTDFSGEYKRDSMLISADAGLIP